LLLTSINCNFNIIINPKSLPKMKRTVLTLLLLFFITILFAQNNQKRLALVIGNSEYQQGGALKNPVNDANLIAQTLQSLGFEVKKIINADLRQMQNAAVEFTDKISNYRVALFYYAGHGVQVDGINYLIPVDAKIDDELRTKYEAFDINDINYAFARNSSNMNIMILDACRDNPFRSWMRGGKRGFTVVRNQASGTIIAFATREGETASDGKGNNGLYTEKLVAQMKLSQNIIEVFQNTRSEVLRASNNKQCPQEWNMLTNNFSLIKKKKSNLVNNNEEVEFEEGHVTYNYGSLIIDSEVGGKFYLDGKLKGEIKANSKDNKIKKIVEGKHSLKIVGKKTWTRTFTITRNQTEHLKLVLKKVRGGEEIYDKKTGCTMVAISGGSFKMGSYNGSTNERPVHIVKVRSFAMSRTEVTVAQFKKFIDATGYKTDVEKKGYGYIWTTKSKKLSGANWKSDTKGNSRPSDEYDHPVIFVSWNDAVAFCKWAGGRLPTEAEWEYAAKSNSSNKYAGSNTIDNVAWYVDNARNTTHPVGEKQPNAFGLYDITGNVNEWCSDWYGKDYYNSSPQNNPQGRSSGVHRVNRGGGWDSKAEYSTLTYRGHDDHDLGFYNTSFRLVFDQ